MDFGISTSCFYPEYTEIALDDLAKNGVKNLEIFLNTYSETQPGYAMELKSKLEYYGMQVVSVHPFSSGFEPFLFFTNYYRRFIDGMAQYQMYFDFMNRVGAKILVFHGNRMGSPFPDEEYYERFALLRDKAKEQGVILAQENVAPYKSRSLDFLNRMKDYLKGDVSFVLDIKQTVRAEQDIYAMIHQLGKNIIHTHVSDHRAGFDCLPIGSGDFDFDAYFTSLKQVGFSGCAMLELYRDNYGGYEELYDSLKRLQFYQ